MALALSALEEAKMLTSSEYLEEILHEAAMTEYMSIDTEGTELQKGSGNKLHSTPYRDGRGFAYGASIGFRNIHGIVRSAYFPILHEEGNIPDDLWEKLKILINNHPNRVFHNASHDIVALRTLGIEIVDRFFCTVQMVHWIDENTINKSLDAVSLSLLGEGKDKSPEFEACLAIFGWTPKFPAAVMAKYAAADADRTIRNFEILLPEFIKQGFHE